jgi:hypothetical protein
MRGLLIIPTRSVKVVVRAVKFPKGIADCHIVAYEYVDWMCFSEPSSGILYMLQIIQTGTGESDELRLKELNF